MTPAQIGAHYDTLAEGYAEWRARTGTLDHLRRLGNLLAPGSRILDLGCGAGVPVDRYLVDQGHSVQGIDLSRRMIALARVNVSGANYGLADMGNLETDAYAVDAVVSFYAIFHVPRERHGTLFRTIRSFLPDGGSLLVTVGYTAWEATEPFHGGMMYWSHYGAADNRRLIEKAGFRIEFEGTEVDDDASGGKHLVILATAA